MITLQWIHEHLSADRHALDDELAIHAQVLFEIGQQVAELGGQVKESKRLVDEAEAQAIAIIKAGEHKITAAVAEKEARSTELYLRAWRHYLTVNLEHDKWTEARAAWTQKGYSLRGLGDLFGNEYFAVNSVRKPADMSDVRAAMRERTGDFSAPAPRQAGRRRVTGE